MKPSEEKKLRARASMLSDEIDANELENRFMLKEYEEIHEKIGKARERARRKAERKEALNLMDNK